MSENYHLRRAGVSAVLSAVAPPTGAFGLAPRSALRVLDVEALPCIVAYNPAAYTTPAAPLRVHVYMTASAHPDWLFFATTPAVADAARADADADASTEADAEIDPDAAAPKSVCELRAGLLELRALREYMPADADWSRLDASHARAAWLVSPANQARLASVDPRLTRAELACILNS